MIPVFQATPETKMEAIKKFCQGPFDEKLGYIEKRLKENSSQDYMVGEKITIADVVFLNAYYSMWLDENTKNEERNSLYKAAIDKHPLFVKYVQGLRKLFDGYWESARIKSLM